jgi:hypothetical protein
MPGLDTLLDCVGHWTGTSHLQVSPDAPGEDSPSTLDVGAALGGRFVHVDQRWSYHDKAQQGTLLVGFDPESNIASIHWIDTWHMGHKVMACSGRMTDTGGVDARGGYAAPPGADWGWRVTIDAVPGSRIEIVMFNIDPAGGGGDAAAEQLAVRATYAPG